MKRRLWIIVLLSVGVFGIVSFARRDPVRLEDDVAALKHVASEPAARRDSLTQFWKLYRQAADYRMSGMVEQAAGAYEQALLLNPTHEDALYYLGNMHLQLGDYSRAGTRWAALAEVNPHSTRAHKRMGDLHFCYPESPMFDLDAADKAYRRALAINKEETGPVMRVGLLQIAQGNLKGAVEYLSAVTASNFKSVPAHYFLGYVAWKAGDEKRAAEFFEAALSLIDEETKSTDPVAGEGDTRTGSRPLKSDELGCSALELYLRNFRESTPEMQSSYTELDVYFRSLRTR